MLAQKNIKPISTREQQVLELIAYEQNTEEIAKSLFISAETVQTHRKNLLKKLQVRNTAGMIRVGFEHGLLQIMV